MHCYLFIYFEKNNVYNISGLLDFRKSGDQDGFVGDFSAKTKVTTEVYQLKIRTKPGKALFEVSITHDLTKNIFHIKVRSDHSITNRNIDL